MSFLGTELNVKNEDLSDGSVSGEADILVLAAPKELDEKQLFAVDQFLMKGGTVIAATSPYQASLSNRSISLQKQDSGLEKWLEYYGLSIENQLVLDPQNSAFPIPVTRNVGGLQFQDIRMLDYPYFVNVRGDGLNQDNLITSELPQATIAWASPIKVDADRQGQRKLTELLRSSDDAWLSNSFDIMPKISEQGVSAFSPDGEKGAQLLGLVSQGRFDSYFAGKTSPLIAATENDQPAKAAESTDPDDSKKASLQITSVIERSPESARIILFSSNDFLRDLVLQMAGNAQQTDYLNTLQMAANAVDWSLEDSGLLSIRSRGNFNRTLPPMEQSSQMFWGYLNYGLAAFALIAIALFERRKRHLKQLRYFQLLAR